MDKTILDALIKFGLVTNIDVDAEKYETVDDLINKGIVTIPGAKTKILEIIENLGVTPIEVNPITEPIVEVLLDENPIDVEPITELNIIDETPESPEIIDETPVSETPIEEPTEVATVIEEVVETPVEVTPTETADAVETPKKTTKKTTKKTE